jgi:protein-disulfide isomerase
MKRREFMSLLGAAAALRPRAAWEMLSSETVRTLVAGAAAVASDGGFALVDSIRAHAVSLEELNNPGPLPDMVLGSPDAPITIIEYASLTCSHCAQFATTTFPEFKARYIDTGKVRYIFREFPLDELAAAASMLARSVGNDRYFFVIETLFRQQRQWVTDRIQPLMTLATKELGFTEQSFKASLANQELLDAIKAARDRASKVFEVDATPTFFINGTKVRSYQTMKQMERLIDPLLKS